MFLHVFLPPAVLEILQLVKKRDLFLADTHILELERECSEWERSAAPAEDAISPSIKDGGRRKAKDVELLYEELQKELWSVVRESLRSPTAGPNLGLVVQVSSRVGRCCLVWRLSPESSLGRWAGSAAGGAGGSGLGSGPDRGSWWPQASAAQAEVAGVRGGSGGRLTAAGV